MPTVIVIPDDTDESFEQRFECETKELAREVAQGHIDLGSIVDIVADGHRVRVSRFRRKVAYTGPRWMDLRCSHCQRPFETKDGRRRVCSRACAKAAKKAYNARYMRSYGAQKRQKQ